MIQIYNLEELCALGNLDKDCLLIQKQGVIKFMEDIKIPYTLKVTGDVVFSSAQMRDVIEFTNQKAAFTSAVIGNSLTFKNIQIKTNHDLLNIKPNTIERLSFDNCLVDVKDMGSAHFKTLNFTETRFINESQKPLDIGSCNSITAIEVSTRSARPLLSIKETRFIRDQITIHTFRDHESGGFIAMGTCDADDSYTLAGIPRRAIFVKRIKDAPSDLLRVLKDDCYTTIALPVARKYFG